MSEFQDIVLRALETAQKAGAQKARIRASRSQSLSISWRKNKVENMTSSGESALSLSLFVDGKFGGYSTSDLRPESVDAFISKCVDITRLLEADPARDLPDPERYKDRYEGDLETYDPACDAVTPAELIDVCRELEEHSLAHKELPIIDASIEAELSKSETFLANSNGFSGSQKGTNYGYASEIVLQDGDKKPSDYGYSSTRFKSDVLTPKEVADEAAHFCAMKLGQKKLPSGNRTIIFDRRVAASMIKKFISPLDGMAIVMKSSYFMDKIGEKMASDLLDLRCDPWLKRSFGACAFDDEGMSTAPYSMFDKGCLKQYLLSVYSANKLGLKPTTNKISAIILTPGTRSLEEMIADAQDGIYVTGLLGGNQDNVRGDFSHGIVGVAIENGKLTTPVSEMNITGNHTDLWKRLTEVGNDIRRDASSRIPSIRIDDVAVSGS